MIDRCENRLTGIKWTNELTKERKNYQVAASLLDAILFFGRSVSSVFISRWFMFFFALKKNNADGFVRTLILFLQWLTFYSFVNTRSHLCQSTDGNYQPFGLGNSPLTKLTTVVEGNPKVLFSIATTPRCRRRRYSFPRIDPLYPWSIPYNSEY